MKSPLHTAAHTAATGHSIHSPSAASRERATLLVHEDEEDADLMNVTEPGARGQHASSSSSLSLSAIRNDGGREDSVTTNSQRRSHSNKSSSTSSDEEDVDALPAEVLKQRQEELDAGLKELDARRRVA